MKKTLFAIFTVFLLVLAACSSQGQSSSKTSSSAKPATSRQAAPKSKRDFGKVAVVYFSLTNNTKQVADAIHQQVGGDEMAVQTVKPYSKVHDETTKEVQNQVDHHQLPQLKATNIDWTQYDTIFVGSPVWFGDLSLPMQQFFKQTQFKAGTHVAPFFTSGAVAPTKAAATEKHLNNAPRYSQPLGVNGSQKAARTQRVQNWLNQLKFQ